MLDEEKALHARGEAVRRQLVGEERFKRSGSTTYADPLMQEFLSVTTTAVFGTLWSRQGIDLKTRTLICVISDAATGREAELDIHLQMALRMGWTRDELKEVLLHLLGYVGAPLARDAMLVLSAVCRRMDNEGERADE